MVNQTLRTEVWNQMVKTDRMKRYYGVLTEAQHTTSRLAPCNGPSGSRTAQAAAPNSALFPLPRPTVNAASPS